MKPKFLLIFLLFLACKKEQALEAPLLDFLPQDPSVILKINKPTALKSELKNNTVFQKLKSTSIFSGYVKDLKHIDLSLIKENSLLAWYPLGKETHGFILLQSLDSVQIPGPISEKVVANFMYDDWPVQQIQIGKGAFFKTTIENTAITSASRLLIEKTIRNYDKNVAPAMLKKLYRSANTDKAATLFINSQSDALFPQIPETAQPIDNKNFADWMATDITMLQDELLLNGISMAKDSTKRFTHLFTNTGPTIHKTAAFAPQSAEALLSFSFDDFGTFIQNQNVFLDRSAPLLDDFKNIEEIGVVFINGKKTVVIHAFDNEALDRSLAKIKKGSSEYQGSEIWEIEEEGFVNKLFPPLIQNAPCNYYCLLGNAHLFAPDRNSLQTIIANKSRNLTYDKGKVYTTLKEQLGEVSSMLFVSGTKGAHHFMETHFGPSLGKELKNAPLGDLGLAVQLTSDQGFSHFNVLVSELKETATNHSVAPVFNVVLDTDLAMDPKFVKNHRNKEYEILVQDQDHNAYLISNKGKVLWKKSLDAKIQGEVHQVDLFKNGKLQFAFCTANQLLVLDRNGEEVSPFPKTFEGGNLNPLAVFDYEGNREYRFVVTQGKKVMMYNAEGNLVEGFSYTTADSPIKTPPRHFKIFKKDYLVFQLENGQLKIKHRAGGDRIKVDRTIDFSDNPVFLYKNKFSTTDKKGVLHQVDSQGKLSATNFNLSENHGLFTTSKTLVLMDDNTLSIKGKKVELELGVYTAPKIFYINDKIYVTVTDIQNQKIYLFDSQARPIPNFPVYGSSIIDLVDMDNDKKLELVAKDQENSIIVYRMN